MEQYEQFFICPHCGESISVLLDLSVLIQEFQEPYVFLKTEKY